MLLSRYIFYFVNNFKSKYLIKASYFSMSLMFKFLKCNIYKIFPKCLVTIVNFLNKSPFLQKLCTDIHKSFNLKKAEIIRTQARNKDRLG